MVNKDVTTNEIMDFLQENMVMREEFNELKQDVSCLKQDVSCLKQDVSIVKLDLVGLSQKLNQTKLDLLDAMDDKLGDLKGDKVISEKDAAGLIDIRPFPQSIA